MRLLICFFILCFFLTSCASRAPIQTGSEKTAAEKLVLEAKKRAEERRKQELKLLEQKAEIASKIKEERLDLKRVYVLVNGQVLSPGVYVPPNVVEVPIHLSYKPQSRKITQAVLKELEKKNILDQSLKSINNSDNSTKKASKPSVRETKKQ